MSAIAALLLAGTLVGTPAPELKNIEWLQGGEQSVEKLTQDGKAVLIRFWLIGCPYCKATAPSLNTFHEKYEKRGLVVIGIHHPKSDHARKKSVVKKSANGYGFEFPIGLDNSWTTIRSYGVGTELTEFTSVSFLVGTDGKIAWVHEGGEYHTGGGKKHKECNEAFEELDSLLDKMLEDK